MSGLRLLARTIRFQIKTLTLSGFFLLISVLQPLIFASIAFFMWEAGANCGSASDTSFPTVTAPPPVTATASTR